MPSLDVIRNLTIRATQQGVTETTAALNSLAGAQGRVATSAGTMATVTDLSSRRSLSAATALERLAAKHDETYRAQQQHARGTALLERATAQGLSGTKEFAIAQAALNKIHHDAVGAHHAAGEAVGFNRMQMMEATHVAKAFFDEISAGQSPLRALQVEGGRIAQIFAEGQGGVGGTFKALGGMLGRLATGWVGLSVGIGATALAAGAAALSYENSQARMQRAIEGTGRAAGMTRAQLDAVAKAGAAQGNLGLGEARTIAGDFAQAGIGASQSQALLGTTERFGRFSGQDDGDAGKMLAAAFKDPVAGATTLDRSLGFLNDRLSTTIRDYEASGQHAQAQIALQDAYEAALKGTTDSTWALGDAMKEAKRFAGGVFDRLGGAIDNALTGGLSKEDQLAEWKRQLPGTSNGWYAVGNQSTSFVQAKIDALERELATKVDPAAAAHDAETDRLSKLVGPMVRGILPELTRATDASNNLNLLRQALTDPGIVAKLGGGLGRDQVETAFQRTAVVSANADPMRRMMQDYDLAKQSADAFSLAERAAVDARRAEVAVLRETGDVSRAAMAAEIARNDVIAKANSDAEDRLGAARDQASLVGLFGADRAKEELRLKFDGYGGQYAKDAASKSELNEAMQPVARDLHDAGESIAKALRDAAASIAASVAGAMPGREEMGPFNPAPFSGKAGVSDHERTAVEMLVQAGYGRAASVGFVGGLAGESGTGLDPRALNSASGAYGIEQVIGGRKDALMATPNHDDFIVQMKFLIHELATSEASAAAALKGATTMSGGLSANLLFERPSQKEIASSYNARQAYGDALGMDLANSHHVGQTVYGLPPLTVGRAANNNVPGAPPPVAGVTPIAATALGTDHQVYDTEEAARRKAELIGPIHDATVALDAQRASLAASIGTFGMSTAAVAAAAEKQKLLSQYAGQNITLDDATRTSIDRLAESYGALAKQQEDARNKQQALVSAMDDVRAGAKGFLDPLISAGLHGTSVMAALHSGLESVASKISGKIEDTAIDSLFGKSGTTGGGLFGGGLSSLFGAGQGGGFLSSLGSGFAAGGYTGDGGRFEPAGIAHKGEYVFSQAAVSKIGVGMLHAMHTTGRVPGYADGGYVGGMPSSSSGVGDMSGGDLHVHVYGGSGDDHIRGLVRQGVSQGIAQNNAQLPAMMADRQKRVT